MKSDRPKAATSEEIHREPKMYVLLVECSSRERNRDVPAAEVWTDMEPDLLDKVDGNHETL